MKIRYGASMTVPHPSIPYANVKPTLEAEVECEEADCDAALAELRRWVERSLSAGVASLNDIVSGALQ